MLTTPWYNLLVLGAYKESRNSELQEQLQRRMHNLGLNEDLIKIIHLCDYEKNTEIKKYPLLVLYFGYNQNNILCRDLKEENILEEIQHDSIQIITIVHDLDTLEQELPNCLRHINAMKVSEIKSRLINLILESFRLLRQERRLFISYKRADSSSIATQLYDVLDSKGFDVFLDSRSVPFGVDFQEVLWHRMADSDIVVLIDSPNFSKGEWTREELRIANETNIQIIHLLYPGQEEDEGSAFSHFIRLVDKSYESDTEEKKLTNETMDEIVIEIEDKRARALSSRYNYLINNFSHLCNEVNINIQIQPERYIIVGQGDVSSKYFVIPAIGVPDSKLLHTYYTEIAEKGYDKTDNVWVLYDNRGIMREWVKHLSWLDEHLPIHTVSMLQVENKLNQEFGHV